MQDMFSTLPAPEETLPSPHSLRDNPWLLARVTRHIQDHFPEIRTLCSTVPLRIRFNPQLVRAAASFRVVPLVGEDPQFPAAKSEVRLTVTGLYQNPIVPEYVVDETLCHELAHYIHLFCPVRYPHRGGVVESEMARRGCGHLVDLAVRWRRDHWARVLREVGECRYERTPMAVARWQDYLARPGFRSMADISSRMLTLSGWMNDVVCPEPRWRGADRRHVHPSYLAPRPNRLLLHELLADPVVPDEAIDYQLFSFLAQAWIMRGRTLDEVAEEFCLLKLVDEGHAWEADEWPVFREMFLPEHIARGVAA